MRVSVREVGEGYSYLVSTLMVRDGHVRAGMGWGFLFGRLKGRLNHSRHTYK